MGFLDTVLDTIHKNRKIKCTSCSAEFFYKIDDAGKKTVCPECRNIIQLPYTLAQIETIQRQELLEYKRHKKELNLKEQVKRKQAFKDYERELSEILRDGLVADEELSTLKATVEKHKQYLPESLIKRLHKKKVEETLQLLVADKKISDSEDKALRILCNKLNINFSEVIGNTQKYNRMKIFAQIEEGTLPEFIDIPFVLKKNEKCHYTALAYSLKKVVGVGHKKILSNTIRTRGEIYDQGLGVFGSDIEVAQEEVVTQEQVSKPFLSHLTYTSSGTFFVTNQRIFFAGLHETVVILIAQIVNISFNRDRIRISSENLKEPLLLKLDDPKLAHTILKTVVNHARS